MTEIYLFDWGDTLMIDFPDESGKMCEWSKVEAISGAKRLLERLSTHSKIYIATSAADSTESDIEKAFVRVGLNDYISGYFCRANLGFSKSEPEFFPSILKILRKEPNQITMVGDSFDKDIAPALALGMRAVWLSSKQPTAEDCDFLVVASLLEFNSRLVFS